MGIAPNPSRPFDRAFIGGEPLIADFDRLFHAVSASKAVIRSQSGQKTFPSDLEDMPLYDPGQSAVQVAGGGFRGME
ncbi:hypothetical protein IPC475_28700 [Pseudomonas aeruginosa]|nr:hypothetical protein IPC475_28700 [Pseudomonas aeruginosa]